VSVASRPFACACIGLGLAIFATGCGSGPGGGASRAHSDGRSQLRADAQHRAEVHAGVKRNQTTQEELVRTFGPPNVTTQDGTGLETWVYERGPGQTRGPAPADGYRLSTFFGAGDPSGANGEANNVTVIVKFNPDRTVRDYSVRQSTF
jgi:hypothetical protein